MNKKRKILLSFTVAVVCLLSLGSTAYIMRMQIYKFLVGRHGYPPNSMRKEHKNYVPLKLPYELTYLTPSYLGYHLDRYPLLKSTKISKYNEESDEKKLDTVFKETIFDRLIFSTDNAKYLQSLYFTKYLPLNDTLVHNNVIRRIFTILRTTYGDYYTKDSQNVICIDTKGSLQWTIPQHLDSERKNYYYMVDIDIRQKYI